MAIPRLVHGKNCLFMVDFGDGYRPVVCAKGFSFSSDTELKETTSRGSGVYKEYDYKAISSRANLTGLVKVADLAADAIFFDLAFYQQNFLELKCKCLFTDDSGASKVVVFTGIIANSTFNASAPQLADASVDIQVSGSYYMGFEDPNSCVNSITSISFNGNEWPVGSSLILQNDQDLSIVVNELANPSLEIFRYDYELDSYGRNSAFSSGTLPFDLTTIEMSGYPNGAHLLKIIPVCQNGVDGNVLTVELTKLSPL